jgi:hypothetical protein
MYRSREGFNMDLGLNRRSSLRITAVGTVILTVGGETFEGVPLDVGGGGARVRIRQGREQRMPWPGARLRLDFIRRLGRPAFTVDCVVVRISGDGRDVCLKFELNEFGAVRLRRFLENEAAELGIPLSDLGDVVSTQPGSPTPPKATSLTTDHAPRELVGWLAAAAAVGTAATLLIH